MQTLLWILGATLGTSFVCSILEATLLSVSHSHIAMMQGRGEWAGEWFKKVQKNIDEPIAAILTLNTIANTMGASLGGAVAGRAFGNVWAAGFSAILTFSVLIFSEIVPKTLGATYWRTLAKPSAYVIRFMIVLMKPLLIPLGFLARLMTGTGERPTISRAELEVLAEIGRREGTLDEDEFSVVSRVIRLDEVSVGEVMTPRTDLIGIPSTASIEDAQSLMLETGHLRLPVYDGNLDTITGVLVGRDIWRAAREGKTSIDEFVRQVPFALTSKRVDDLIPEMRSQLTKMAIVVDEFGGTAGLVTLEDLIEEIIGEIQDEHEGDEPLAFHPLGPGRMRVWGGTSLREASQRLRFEPTEDEEEGFDTVGGLVFGRLNRIPVVGDEIEVTSGRLRVTQMNGRRVEYLVFVRN
jgi:CBS domain containing-hemolysin-like protein